jgi:hypothetical protein
MQIDIDKNEYFVGLAGKASPQRPIALSKWFVLTVLIGLTLIVWLLFVVFKKKTYEEVSRAAMASQDKAKDF